MRVKIEGDTPEQVYELLRLMAGSRQTVTEYPWVKGLECETVTETPMLPREGTLVTPTGKLVELGSLDDAAFADVQEEVDADAPATPTLTVVTGPRLVEAPPEPPPAETVLTEEDADLEPVDNTDPYPESLLNDPLLVMTVVGLYAANPRLTVTDVCKHFKDRSLPWKARTIKAMRTLLIEDDLLRTKGTRAPTFATERGMRFKDDPEVQAAIQRFTQGIPDVAVLPSVPARTMQIEQPATAREPSPAPKPSADADLGASLFGDDPEPEPTPKPVAVPAPKPVAPAKQAPTGNGELTVASMANAIQTMLADVHEKKGKDAKTQMIARFRATLQVFGVNAIETVDAKERPAFMEEIAKTHAELVA